MQYHGEDNAFLMLALIQTQKLWTVKLCDQMQTHV